MFRVPSGFLYGALIVLLGSGIARADINDTFDANASLFGDGPDHVSMDRGPWDFSLSAGLSSVSGADTTISSPQTFESFPFNAKEYFINFPPGTYSVNSLSNGYSLQLVVTRRILTDWLTLGFQGGVSLGNKQQVAEGVILFSSYDAFGNLLSQQNLGYDIDYSLLVYHIEPILQFGPWIPLGNYALKPYVSIGGGVNQAVETVTLSVAGADFQLDRRSTTSFGVLTGAGIDFQFWRSGAIGVEYQYQRIFSSAADWTLMLPTLRFSYLF